MSHSIMKLYSDLFFKNIEKNICAGSYRHKTEYMVHFQNQKQLNMNSLPENSNPFQDCVYKFKV